MQFSIYQLNKQQMDVLLNKVIKKFENISFKLHNIYKSPMNPRFIRFNIVYKNGLSLNSFSQELADNISVGYLSIDKGLLFLEYENDESIESFERLILNDNFIKFKLTKEFILSLVDDKEHINVSEILYRELLDNTLLVEDNNYKELLEEEIRLEEVSYFIDNQHLFKLNKNGILYSDIEFNLEKTLIFL